MPEGVEEVRIFFLIASANISSWIESSKYKELADPWSTVSVEEVRRSDSDLLPSPQSSWFLVFCPQRVSQGRSPGGLGRGAVLG